MIAKHLHDHNHKVSNLQFTIYNNGKTLLTHTHIAFKWVSVYVIMLTLLGKHKHTHKLCTQMPMHIMHASEVSLFLSHQKGSRAQNTLKEVIIYESIWEM